MNWFKKFLYAAKKPLCKGWVAVRMNSSVAKKIQQWGKDNIPAEELSDDGRDKDTHITVMFGVCSKNHEMVKKALDGQKPVKAKLGKIGCFVNNDGFDVVIVKINSPDLEKLHKKIADELHVEETHDEYKPHCTIAYVKKGEARKYAGDDVFEGEELIFHRAVFKDGTSEKETMIALNG
jgi:2'-5' RNA ligase